MPKTSELQSPKNPLVQALKKLKRHPPVDEGKVIVEGVRLIDEAFRSGAEFETLFYTAEFQSSEIVNKVENAVLVSESVMKSVSLESTPPGLLAVVRIPAKPLTFEKSIVVLCSVRDPGNAGTLLRTAEAVDCSVFFSNDSVHPYHPKVVKGSMGSSFRVPSFRGEIAPFLKSLKEKSYEIVGTASVGGISYDQWSPKEKFALLLGGEASGLPVNLLSTVDTTLSIPLSGQVESLNVAVAGAVLLFEARRRKS